jgi:hypothetical protein
MYVSWYLSLIPLDVEVVLVKWHGDGGLIGGLEQGPRAELVVVVQTVQVVDVPASQ